MSEALGGSVSFESQEGKGTKFIVCLPNQFFLNFDFRLFLGL
jgi:signal transduction histidine kinase